MTAQEPNPQEAADQGQPVGERPAPSLAPVSERQPFVIPPFEILQAYQARVLNPAEATRLTPQEIVYPTVYVGDQLLVEGGDQGAAWPVLLDIIDDKFRLIVDPRDRKLLGLAVEASATRATRSAEGAEPAADDDEREWPVVRVKIVPNRGDGVTPQPPADAWVLLQDYRARVQDAGLRNAVGLNHLLSAAMHWSPSGEPPATAPVPLPPYGDRMPVAWLGGPPARQAKFPGRRPVVAVLDTEIGPHPWFNDQPDGPIVIRDQYVDGHPLGHIGTYAGEPTILNPLQGVLDPDAGHGTFIAGLIRQQAPDANILQVTIMATSGTVEEADVIQALELLVRRQRKAIRDDDAASFVDVVTMSLGYYHEAPPDQRYDHLLNGPLRELGRLGVAVVASAGNDATTRPFYPAALTPHAKGIVPVCTYDHVPVVSVGADNPDGTVALFSNAGDWVVSYRTGAALVSTMPINYDAGAQPAYRVEIPGFGTRESIDPDDYRQGFGVWSGTSFAGPVLAGQLLAEICAGHCGPIDPIARALAVDRGWRAVSSQTKFERPAP